MSAATQPSEGVRALVVTAHPDDVDFNAAGTVAKWVKSGVRVSYLLVTSGDAGGSGDVPRAEIPAMRRREQCEAAGVLGVHDVRFLDGYRDGHVEVSDGLVRDITRVIRDVRPHRVMALSPERDWSCVHQGHPDHLAVGEATARAVYPAARTPLLFPELLERENLAAWTVEELWIQEHPRANHAEDVTDVFDLKVRAILAHVSQFPDTEGIADRLRDRLSRDAQAMGLAPDRLAERFLKTAVHGDPLAPRS
jgi:LmbE family N-acetylglucosaminyl deacetylase